MIVGWIATTNSLIAASKVNTLKNFPTTYVALNNVLSNRLDIWEAGMNMGSQNLMTGVGAKAFNHAYATYKSENDSFEDQNERQHPRVVVQVETA